MKCPVCGNEHLKIIDSRAKANGIQRRRECQDCLTRFNTYERILINSIPEYLKERVINNETKNDTNYY